jgi:hypothetical protein
MYSVWVIKFIYGIILIIHHMPNKLGPKLKSKQSTMQKKLFLL